jgi:hypothetical protein
VIFSEGKALWDHSRLIAWQPFTSACDLKVRFWNLLQHNLGPDIRRGILVWSVKSLLRGSCVHTELFVPGPELELEFIELRTWLQLGFDPDD